MLNSEREVEALATALGLQLPAVYRQWLTAYPESVSSAQYSRDPDFGGPSDFELLSSCKRILKLNQEIRKHWAKSDYADSPLPESYLLIGEDGCGNLFAVDTANAEGQVLEFEHEAGEWSQRAVSIEDFGRQLIEMAAELRSSEK